MGFFGILEQAKITNDKMIEGFSLDLLHRCECQVCPLNRAKLTTPKMKPHGSKHPLVYILGEAPGQSEDEEGIPFIGASGEVLRLRIPAGWKNDIRFNNVIRCHPEGNRDPTRIEMEACRPSIEQDIAASKPKAIFGMGGWPLQWALRESGITKWRGRRVPVEIGGHRCWFYPMFHPSFILRTRKFTPKNPEHYASDVEFAFALDLKRAFAEVRAGLPEPIVHTPEEATRNIDVILDPNEAINAIHRMYDAKVLGFDYETSGLRPFVDDARILTVALASAKEAFAFPLEHLQCTWSLSQRERVLAELNRFLYEAKVSKAVHNLPFEQEWSAYYFGPDCLRAQRWDCTQSQAYLLYGKRGSDYEMGGLSLDFLCLQHFGIHIKALNKLNKTRLDDEPLDKVLRYNGLDARYHLRLFQAQDKEIDAANLRDVYEHQLRRIPTMVITQIHGIPIDQEQTRMLETKYEDQIKKIEQDLKALPEAKKFRKMKRADYRPSSTQDVKYMYQTILRAHLAKTNGETITQVPIEKTDEETISQVIHPITDLTLDWRKTKKKLSTYVKPMLDKSDVLFADGKLHPVILVTSTDTWRTSSHEPNVQNWPKHQQDVLEIRKQIAAPRGHQIVSFDYSGIQARNVAMESLDKKLVDAFWDDYDIHADWRDKIAKVYPRWVEEGVAALRDPKIAKKYRQQAKNGFVFATFFGAHETTLTRHLGIPPEYTKELREMFMEEFHGIADWHAKLHKDFYKTGYVTGKSGHKRYAPVSQNQLINAPIQADEALIVCDAMNRLSEMEDDRYQPILEVHDDLTFCWPTKDVDKNAEVVITAMLDVPFKWARVVPIGVEMSIGQNWGEMKDTDEKFTSKTWHGGLW